MFIERGPGQISIWHIVFTRNVPSPLWNYLIPGKFKHVQAFGFCAEANTWVFIDPAFTGVDVIVVPDNDVNIYIEAAMVGGCEVLSIARRRHPGPNFRVVCCCTSQIRHLIGLPGWGPRGLVPDRLYRDCLKAGALPFLAGCVEAKPEDNNVASCKGGAKNGQFWQKIARWAGRPRGIPYGRKWWRWSQGA
jgi:hypothetical protein